MAAPGPRLAFQHSRSRSRNQSIRGPGGKAGLPRVRKVWVHSLHPSLLTGNLPGMAQAGVLALMDLSVP